MFFGREDVIDRAPGVSARAALVYSGHLSPVVAADGYFDAIVPFRRLLGLLPIQCQGGRR